MKMAVRKKNNKVKLVFHPVGRNLKSSSSVLFLTHNVGVNDSHPSPFFLLLNKETQSLFHRVKMWKTSGRSRTNIHF